MILEVRTYTAQTGGGTARWLEHYEKHGLPPAKRHLGPLVRRQRHLLARYQHAVRSLHLQPALRNLLRPALRQQRPVRRGGQVPS